jgi:DNA-binding MarR family transcriptional regulator
MKQPKQRGRSTEGDAVTALIFATFRTNGRLLRAGDALTRDLGLTSSRWQVLGAIADTPKTVAQIAREFELARQGVSPVVNALIKAGIVELITNPNHRRASLVQMTPAGRKIYHDLERRQNKWVNDLGENFRLADIKKATALLTELSEAIGRHPSSRTGV